MLSKAKITETLFELSERRITADCDNDIHVTSTAHGRSSAIGY